MWMIKGKIEWNVAEAQKCAPRNIVPVTVMLFTINFLATKYHFVEAAWTDLAYQQKIQFKFSSTQLALPADMPQPQSMADSAQHHTT